LATRSRVTAYEDIIRSARRVTREAKEESRAGGPRSRECSIEIESLGGVKRLECYGLSGKEQVRVANVDITGIPHGAAVHELAAFVACGSEGEISTTVLYWVKSHEM
jgi:hypothetical protein